MCREGSSFSFSSFVLSGQAVVSISTTAQPLRLRLISCTTPKKKKKKRLLQPLGTTPLVRGSPAITRDLQLLIPLLLLLLILSLLLLLLRLDIPPTLRQIFQPGRRTSNLLTLSRAILALLPQLLLLLFFIRRRVPVFSSLFFPLLLLLVSGVLSCSRLPQCTARPQLRRQTRPLPPPPRPRLLAGQAKEEAAERATSTRLPNSLAPPSKAP